MNQAYRFLGPRFLSTYELRQKMSLKGVPTDLIDQVEERLLELDFLNDERLSEDALRLYMEAHKYSRFYIKNKMRQRGLTVRGLEKYDELKVAFELVERRFHMDEDWYEAVDAEEEEKVERKKLINYLKNRGFSVGTIQTICSELSPYLTYEN